MGQTGGVERRAMVAQIRSLDAQNGGGAVGRRSAPRWAGRNRGGATLTACVVPFLSRAERTIKQGGVRARATKSRMERGTSRR